MKQFPMTAEVVAEKIDVKLTDWPGNCHLIASLMIERGLCSGRVARGAYDGYINADSMFGGRPCTQHSWIERRTSLVDPTRWVFTGRNPFIWVGPRECPDYDLGCARLRKATGLRRPFPVPSKAGAKMIQVPRPLRKYFVGCIWVDPIQLGWGANTPLCDMTRPQARKLYEFIILNGGVAWIPMDFCDAVLTPERVAELCQQAKRNKS